MANDGSILTFMVSATVDPDEDHVEFDGQMQGKKVTPEKPWTENR